MDLKNMLEKAQADHAGFKEIYDLTINRLFSFVLLRIKNKDEALDICQDIYISFWRSLPKFRYISDAHFYSFLFLVARRQIIKARMKKYEKVELEEVLDIEAPEEEYEDYRFLLKHLAMLGDKERTVLELRYFGDLSFGSIAENMGIKENNAKMLHHRAINRLRELIPQYE